MFAGRLALLLAALLGVAPLAGCVTSQTKMVSDAGPPVAPESVAIYGSLPSRYRHIAFIEAHIYGSYFMSDESRRRQAVDSLAQAAARVGANAIIIRNFHPGSVRPFGTGFRAYRMGTSEASFSHMSTMHALAIYVP